MRWLAFRIFNQAAEQQGIRFAIRESQAVELAPFTGVIPPRAPESREGLLGTLTYNGKTLRVFDLGFILGMGAGYLPQRVRLLIARQSRTAAPLGIAVQPELEEVPSTDDADIRIVDLRLLSRIGRVRRTPGQ